MTIEVFPVLEVFNGIEMHGVRVSGFVIGAFACESQAQTLAERLRVARDSGSRALAMDVLRGELGMCENFSSAVFSSLYGDPPSRTIN